MNLRAVRNLANALNGSTALGLMLGAVGRGRPRKVGHLIVFDGVRLPWVTASAMTVGSVVLIMGRSLEEISARVPTLLDHEDEHAWQYAYCFGLPFLPLYFAAMTWSMVRTKDRAAANFFKIQAGLETGGYLRAADQRRRRAERSAWR